MTKLRHNNGSWIISNTSRVAPRLGGSGKDRKTLAWARERREAVTGMRASFAELERLLLRTAQPEEVTGAGTDCNCPVCAAARVEN